MEKEGFVGDMFSWIGTRLTSLWKTADPEVITVFRKFFSEFEGVALQAVIAEAPKLIAGTDKLNNAMAFMGTAVKNAGWTASTGAIQTLVQDAYISWQATQPASHGIVSPPIAH